MVRMNMRMRRGTYLKVGLTTDLWLPTSQATLTLAAEMGRFHVGSDLAEEIFEVASGGRVARPSARRTLRWGNGSICGSRR